MANTLSPNDLIETLRILSKRHGSQQKFAAYLDVAPSVLSELLNGRRLASRHVLERLGYQKVIRYQLTEDK